MTSGEGATAQVSTTQFVSDAEVVTATKIAPISLDPRFLKSSTDQISQEIRDFLAKPVIVASGNFTTTDTFSAFPPYLSPNDIITNSATMSDKLRGYFGFRATTVLRLVVNANRFQQGRYNLQFMPTGGADISTTPAINRISALQNTLVQRSQLPHVELDLSCDTEATMRIPFNSAMNFFPLKSVTSTSSFGSFGLFRIYPYSKLVAPAGSNTCGYTLWAHFEDVELIGAAVPQSTRPFTSQVKKKNETEVEQNSSQMGPISSALIRVRDTANIFTRVPLLSGYASATAWYSDILASAASVFGWSKPINLEHSQRITQNYLPYSANVDGPDNSFPLSFSYKNQVGKAIGFSGTDVDELDFKYLTSIPSYYTTIPWLGTQIAGTSLLALEVIPTATRITRVVNGINVSDCAPMHLVASMFTYWRGTMVYKFKLVKTEFHSGRLAISFSPFEDALASSPASITLNDTDYIHREIIDIRNCNEFTISVPYISSSPYKSLLFYPISTGTLFVNVLDPLVAPDTVSTDISIIVEVCMGPDAEFAVPRKILNSPVYGIAPQSNKPFDLPTNECSIVETSIGSSGTVDGNNTNALFAIGEKISSFRTLLKMPWLITATNVPTASLYFNVLPFANTYTTYTPGGPIFFQTPDFSSDLISILNSCYLYSRGGVRLKYIDNTAVTAAEPFVIYIRCFHTIAVNLTRTGFNFSAADGAVENTAPARAGVPATYYKAGYSGEVQIPQYSLYHSRNNFDLSVSSGNFTYGYNVSDLTTAPRIYVSRTTTPSVATLCSLLRSASDDYNLGGFLSVPPMVGL